MKKVLAVTLAASVVSIGLLGAPAQAAAPACRSGYYENSSGNCVKRPTAAARQPAGATAKCRDGTWSFSQHHSGTCSGHKGVARWL